MVARVSLTDVCRIYCILGAVRVQENHRLALNTDKVVSLAGFTTEKTHVKRASEECL